MRILSRLMALAPITVLVAGVSGDNTSNYSYDAAGRLVKADYGNGSVVLYTYDKAGNLLSRLVQNAGPTITSVNTAFAGPSIAQNAWIAIKGTNLVPSASPAAGVTWNNAPDFASGHLPTKLNGISVTVNQQPAYVSFYCSAATSQVCTSDQINVLTPLDSTIGMVPVVVTNNGVASPPFMVAMKTAVPSFLLFSTNGDVVATHLDNSLLGPLALFPGSSTPARAGETIVVYGVGWGLPSAMITSGSSSQSGSLPALPACTIGNTPAAPGFAGLVSPGLYQFNITVPAGTASGENAISCSYAGASTPAGDVVAVQ